MVFELHDVESEMHSSLLGRGVIPLPDIKATREVRAPCGASYGEPDPQGCSHFCASQETEMELELKHPDPELQVRGPV
jgi:hypothetical protein